MRLISDYFWPSFAAMTGLWNEKDEWCEVVLGGLGIVQHDLVLDGGLF